MTEVVQSKENWETEYESGQWAMLHCNFERAHYAVVAEYIHWGRKPVSLLDVGCGEGVILNYLRHEWLEKYTGVDLAQAALDKITPRRSQDEYICSSLEQYLPAGKWDVILFNEVLYYTADPVANLRKFESSLNPQGIFVISMFQKGNPFAWNNRCSRAIHRYLREAGYEVDDAVTLAKLNGAATWQMTVARPPHRTAGAATHRS